jgi:hypothetical protein
MSKKMQRIKELIDQISQTIIRTVTGSYKGTISPKVKDEIVAMLEKSSDQVVAGTKKIEDQTAELKKIAKYLDDADEKAGISTKEELPANVTRIDDYIKRKADELDDTPKEGILTTGESIPTKPLDDADDFAKKNFPEAKSIQESLNDALRDLSSRTATTVEEARQALITAANEAYLPGSPKRMTDEDDAMLLSYIETQPRLDLLESIIENADSARIQETKETARKIIASEENPADLGFAKEVPLDSSISAKAEAELKKMKEFTADLEKENKILGAIELEIQQNAEKMDEFIKQGDLESARKIADEIKRIQKNTEETGMIDRTFTPFDRTLNAEGGRIGFEPGGDVPGKGKLPMSRRGFMGIMGGGIAAALTAGKGLMPAAKTGITAAKTMSAPGMPSWFPLLVSKIETKGNLVSPAAPNKGEVNAVYKYKDGMTEYRMVEDVNTGRIDVYTTSDDGTQISFEYEPSMQRYFEDGSSVTEDPSFFVGEFRKGSEPLGDFEQYSMGMDEVKSDLRNVIDFATRGTTMKTEDAVANFLKDTKKQEPGFQQGGLVPPQAGPMSSGMGSLFRQRTI